MSGENDVRLRSRKRGRLARSRLASIAYWVVGIALLAGGFMQSAGILIAIGFVAIAWAALQTIIAAFPEPIDPY